MVIPEQVYVTSHACVRLRFIIELYGNPQPFGVRPVLQGHGTDASLTSPVVSTPWCVRPCLVQNDESALYGGLTM